VTVSPSRADRHLAVFPRAGLDEPEPVPGLLPVSLVIPTLNEAANLAHVFARIPSGVHEVIVVDGGSTDATVEVARRLRPDIRIVEQTGRGKGDALRCGFRACSGEIIVMLDADGSTDPGEIARYVRAIHDGAEFAKGSRFLSGGGSADITRLRRAGNSVLCGVVNLLFGTKYSDLCYGYNAFLASRLDAIDVDCSGFEVETLINIRIAKLGLRIAEVPSFEAQRVHGESKLHPFRDGLRVLRVVLRERWRASGSPAAAVLEAEIGREICTEFG